MKPFTFTLRQEPPQRVDLSALTPDRLAGKSVARDREDRDRHDARLRSRSATCSRFAEGDLKTVRYEGGSSRFDLIGAKLLPGFSIHVEGDVGRAARPPREGRQHHRLRARRRLCGFRQRGRRISRSRATSGDFLAAPLAGELAGMSGGRVIVRGKAGARAGDRLRRGILIIEGDAGEDLGSRVIAGTIIVLGKTTGRVGYLNKRGSIVLAKRADSAADLCRLRRAEPDLRQALCARPQSRQRRRGRRSLSGRLRRFGGDTAVYGKGEILTPA